jgi:branched-chain amino acid transport system permease protein
MFLLSLIVEGALAGALYALVALAFVVVYKASHIINFALGEWVMIASILVATGLNVIGLGLVGGILFAIAGMAVLAFAFNVGVLRRLVGQPLISMLMVTLGLGVFLRGIAQLVFAGVPKGIQLPIPAEPFVFAGLLVPADKLVAAVLALATILCVAWYLQRSRTGIALRAIADDNQAAMAVGIDIGRHFLVVWTIAGAICVLAGSLWTHITGGGFGVGILGLKIFPIVVIGGLDSIGGTIIAAIFIGLIESLAAGYLDPHFGTGCGLLVAYATLLVMLFVRPFGLMGVRKVERV